MTTKIPTVFIFAALCLLSSPARAATNDVTSALQRGLFEEEANQNLGAAIQAYQTVANQFDKDRKLAATAIFRLGECYRKQGNTNDAATQYERILREFSDQPTLVTLSRQSLAGMGSAPPAPAAPTMSDAARQEQKRLLAEEIKLVEKQLESQQAQVKVGALPPDGLLPTQRDLLKIKRQLAALDAGLPVSIAATEAPAATPSTEADEVRRIQALIKDSPDLINAPDQKGETLLESAAAKGKLAVVKLLLDSGAAVDGLQQPGLTALHYAAANGHKAIVDLLLSKGAKAEAQTESGITPLHLAALKGYESVAKALLAAGAPVNAETKRGAKGDTEDLQYRIGSDLTPLHLAADGGYASLVELLLAKGADLNAGSKTPLSYAVRFEAVARFLLAAHADPNAGSHDLPLGEAAYFGNMTVHKLLLANGANPNTNSTVSWRVRELAPGTRFTPLFLAVTVHRADAVEELLRAKADPNLPGPDGHSLLFEALPDTRTLKALLEAGADPNRLDAQGISPLLEAVFGTNQLAVELLLAHKADVNAAHNAPNSNAWTPLHAAVASGDKAIAELLLKGGADVNAQAKDGCTPLWLAVDRKQQELAELLLANKADPNERDNSGHTPLDLAKSQAQSAQGQAPGTPVMFPSGPGAPPGPYTLQGAGTLVITPAQASKPEAMADLLRRHGAVDDLPKVDRIMVQRRSSGDSDTAFTKGAHDWGQFTLLELIGVHYAFLAAEPQVGGGDAYSLSAFFNTFSRLPFPDLAHLRIRRPAPGQKSWQEQVVDLRPVLESSDCSKDVRLEWGDVVEIPEADHPLNERWPGFSRTELANLENCLTRQVEIVINGQATNITLAPGIYNVGEKNQTAHTAPMPQHRAGGDIGGIDRIPTIVARRPFWLKPVLLQSKLVLTSSDLRHVKVTRRDSAGGQAREWVVDCSQASPAPNFWLRDGDRVEVPERTDSASAEEATPAPPLSPPQPAAPQFSQRLQSIIQRIPPAPPAQPAAPQFTQRLQNVIQRAPQSSSGQPARPLAGKPSLFEALSDAPTLKGLLEGGADPNVRRSDGTPLLVRAVRDKNQVAVKLLLSHQADVDAADSDGWTPLDYATADGLKPIVELLLKAGTTVNARNPSGETALHIAVRGGQRELTGLLLANKADPNVRNNAGQTPLALARSMGLSLGMGGASPLAPAPETPQAVEGTHLSVGGVLYSPKPDDPELLKAGYQRDRSARTRKAESWEERAGAELRGRGDNTAIWTGTDMIVFGGEGMGVTFEDGARYCLAEDTWALLPKMGGPSSRTGHNVVWTGKEMIIWGGFGGFNGNNINHNDGARYNPSSDTWKPVATKNAPAARFDFPAVWTGREMLVWGGFTNSRSRYQGIHADAYLNSGGRYAPSSDSWKTITTRGAPSKRCWSTMVWTGKEMIIWGGCNATKALGDGGRYSLARDAWKPVNSDGAPSARLGHVAVWTGKEMIVWGGTTRETDEQSVCFENGARYNPETDTWRPISTIGAPKGRVSTFAVWTGAEMVIWGGVNDTQAGGTGDPSRYVGTGARYNPATNTWTEMTVTGAPPARLTAGVWTGEGLLTFGGYNGTHLNDTWFYSPVRTLYAYSKQ